ncbi:hypothetical protein, partial [Pleurochrysis sp. endemic virus unk]
MKVQRVEQSIISFDARSKISSELQPP